MVQRDFRTDLSVGRIIKDLNKEETMQYAVSLIHMLGDLSIGLGNTGSYADYEESVIQRIIVLMTFADMETPYYGPATPYLQGKRGQIHLEERKVQEKAAQVLASLLGKVNKRYGDYNYDEGSVPILEMPLSLINQLIRFYSIKDNIPTKNPARKSISAFLELVYRSSVVKEKDSDRLRPFSAIYKSDPRDKGICHDLVILPLIFIGKIKLLLHYCDFNAIRHLETPINVLAKGKIFEDLDEALEYWLAESQRTVNNEESILILEACEVCMLLKCLKQRQIRYSC